MKCLWYEEPFFEEFLSSVFSPVFVENIPIYTKAIRSTLIALGYNPDYINGEFRDRLEKYFNDRLIF